MIVWVWLLISAAWFAVNAYVLERWDGNFWFVASLPFFIGLVFLFAARVVMGGWKKPPDHMQY